MKKLRIITIHKDRVCYECKKTIKAETPGVRFVQGVGHWCSIDCYLDTKERGYETNEQIRERWLSKNTGYIQCGSCKREVAEDRLTQKLVPTKNGSLMVNGICPVCGKHAKWIMKKYTKFKYSR